jgi:putative transposase
MDGAEPDVLASMSFPRYHRVKIHSTNPIERVNGEIKRRTEVVGIFPNEAAIVRLTDAIPLKQNDEWVVQRAHYMTMDTIALLRDDPLVSLAAVAPDQPGARCRRTRRPGHDHQMCLWSRSERSANSPMR